MKHKASSTLLPMWEHIGHSMLSYWSHILYGLGCIAVFIIIAWIHQWAVKKWGRKRATRWGWSGFNALVIFIGGSASYNQKIVISGITTPHILITPIMIILSLVIAKILVGLISMPLTKGLLPNSVNQTVENKVIENAADAKGYYEALAALQQRMIEEKMREFLTVLRARKVSDDEFINEVLGIMTYSYNRELLQRKLPTEFSVGTLEEMQDPEQVEAPDFTTFTQIKLASQEGKQRYWDTGIAEPFTLWGNTYLLAMYSSDVIPPNILDVYVHSWVTLCDLPFVKDFRLATERVHEMGLTSEEQMDQFLGHAG